MSEKKGFNIRLHNSRIAKLRRVAKQREKTMTQLIEDWIDRLQETEEKPC